VPQQRARAAPDVAHAASNIARAAIRFPCASHMQHSDLHLKHPNSTVATYKRRQMKHLKQTSKTLAKRMKTLENH
jgi:hypothetical protein